MQINQDYKLDNYFKQKLINKNFKLDSIMTSNPINHDYKIRIINGFKQD